MRNHSALLVLVVLIGGCDVFGLDEVTKMEVDVAIPAQFELPARDVPALPEATSLPVDVAVPIDVLATLRADGRSDDAALIEQHQRKVEYIEIVSMTYAVPGKMPVDVSPVRLHMRPQDAAAIDPEGYPIGTTEALIAGQATAARPLRYVDGGREAAEVLLQPMKFDLLANARIEVPAQVAIEAGRMGFEVVFNIRVHLDIAR